MRIIFCVAFCALVVCLYGQPAGTWRLDLGYSGGNFVHPGASAGILKTIGQTLKERKSGKSIGRDVMIGGRAGFFYHKDYQTGLWLQGEIDRRKIRPNGRYGALSLGLGVIRTWVPNSYLVNAGGEVRYRAAKGIPYFLVSPSAEWGWKFKDPKQFLDGCYLRTTVQWHLPYFQGANQYFLFTVGFNLKSKK